MRLFLAIRFDERTMKKLISLRERAREYCPTANFSRDENLHLTLVFLGETAPERIDALKHAMNLKGEPFTIEIDGRDDLGKGLLALSVRHGEPLMRLQSELMHRLIGAGFTLEERSYRPHITLARKFSAQGYHPSFSPISADMTGFSLMRSERIHGQLVYTEIYRHDLRKGH